MLFLHFLGTMLAYFLHFPRTFTALLSHFELNILLLFSHFPGTFLALFLHLRSLENGRNQNHNTDKRAPFQQKAR